MSDYQTPHKDGEVEKSLDEEEDLNDRENAEEFYILMKEKGHSFKTCEGKLLWYDPTNGVYDEESDKLKLKLVNLFATSPVVASKYRGSNSKKSALYREFKSLVPQENNFYEKAQVNTKGFLAFNNCIWDFKHRVALSFDPKFYFTFKANVAYKEHDPAFEMEVLKVVCGGIFGEGEKCEFFMKVLARALAGEVQDKRFIVLLGETNSGKGTLTQLLGDCFGLGTFVGNYTAKELQGESATLSWLMLNKNCRIILANEINAEKPILVNNIKVCANGGEPITGKMLYKNQAHFIPQGTMFLFCNEMPEIKGNDDGDAVKNRMVYVETEYKYLKPQEYEKEKANPKVRLAVPNLKDDYLKRQEVQEAFARFFCKAYVPEAPPLPECCIKKALEYKPTKSLKKILENITEEYGDATSAELSFASTDAETVSPMRRKSDVVEIETLKTENNQLKQELAYIQEEFQNEINNKPVNDTRNNTPKAFTPNKMLLALDASVAIEENKKLIAEIAALKEASRAYVPEESPSELQKLRDENTALKQTLERQNLSSIEYVEEEEDEDPLLVPEVSYSEVSYSGEDFMESKRHTTKRRRRANQKYLARKMFQQSCFREYASFIARSS